MSISLTTTNGLKILIPNIIQPYSVLQLESSATLDEVKSVFKTLILTKDPKERALVSISYAILGSLLATNSLPTYFKKVIKNPLTVTYDDSHPVVMTYIGDFKGLRSKIQSDSSICNMKCENSLSLLYVACRSGFRSIVSVLLEFGCNVNLYENGSTALHAATFYGHPDIVSQLISGGASLYVTNKFGRTALEEAENKEITNLLMESANDPIAFLLQELQQEKLILKTEEIVDEGKIVGYRVERKVENRSYFCSRFQRAWHGTKVEAFFLFFDLVC